mgnify:CR=1 FL=1
MRAGIITGERRLEFLDFADEGPQAGAVRIDISLCGICGTEVASYRNGIPHSASVCGHEWVGVVSELGAGVTSREVGERVVIAVAPACGSCAECIAGLGDYCRVVNAMARGKDPLAPMHGGFASSVCVAADRVVVAHPELSDEQAAVVEPAAVAFHGVRRSGIELGDLVLVQGAGPIGLLAAQCARAAGAGRVIIVEPSTFRREVAHDLGVDIAVEPSQAQEVVMDLSNGRGADVVIESAGAAPLLQVAIDSARQGGTVMLLSYISGQTPVNAARIMAKEVTIRSAVAYSHDDFARTMSLIVDGRIRIEPLHTRTVGLGGLSSALDDLADARTSDIKILVDPRRSS